jgi:hypothetical protein
LSDALSVAEDVVIVNDPFAAPGINVYFDHVVLGRLGILGIVTGMVLPLTVLVAVRLFTFTGVTPA